MRSAPNPDLRATTQNECARQDTGYTSQKHKSADLTDDQNNLSTSASTEEVHPGELPMHIQATTTNKNSLYVTQSVAFLYPGAFQ
jgi:hypothetical protein